MLILTAQSGDVRAMVWMDGPAEEVDRLAAQLAQSVTAGSIALPVTVRVPTVTSRRWFCEDDCNTEHKGQFLGTRFQAGQVEVYIPAASAEEAGVEVHAFEHDPCTLDQALHDLAALLAVLSDAGFLAAVGWRTAPG